MFVTLVTGMIVYIVAFQVFFAKEATADDEKNWRQVFFFACLQDFFILELVKVMIVVLVLTCIKRVAGCCKKE